MVPTNYERVGKAIQILAEGLATFVARECRAKFGDNWLVAVQRHDTRGGTRLSRVSRKVNPKDLQFLLKVMWNNWYIVFNRKLSRLDLNYVSELQDVRNSWAHNESFTTKDTLRALDTAGRLLKSAAADDQAIQVDKLYQDLLHQLCRDLLSQEFDKPANPGVSSEDDKRPTGYTLFGDCYPWRSDIVMWADVVEQVYFRHEYDFLGRAKKLKLGGTETIARRNSRFFGKSLGRVKNYLRLTLKIGPILISKHPPNKDLEYAVSADWQETGVPGIFVYSNLKLVQFIELAYKLLRMFDHTDSDLVIHWD